MTIPGWSVMEAKTPRARCDGAPWVFVVCGGWSSLTPSAAGLDEAAADDSGETEDTGAEERDAGGFGGGADGGTDLVHAGEDSADSANVVDSDLNATLSVRAVDALADVAQESILRGVCQSEGADGCISEVEEQSGTGGGQ